MKYYDEMGRNYRIDGPFFAASTCDVVEFPKVYPTNFASTQFTFDYFGRALTQDRLDETYAHIITSRSYTGATTGLTTMITDPDDRIRDEITDHLGRLHEVVEHVENDVLQHTYYDYNSAGKLVEIVDNAGNTTTISYDVMGRQTGMSDPAMGLWSYTYDSNSNLLTQIDGKNQTTTFGYDELNRLTTKTYSTSDTNSVIYTYDKAGVTNGVGRLGSIDNTSTKSGAKPGVVIAYNEYDAMGRVKSVSKSIAGNPFSNTLYEHDLSGKTTKLTYPDGYALKNTFYPGTNLLHTVEGAADAKTYATVSGYEPGGRIGRLEFGNKLVTTFDYDYGTGRLYETKTQNPLTQANVQWRNYTYTAAGDIWSVKNTLANNEYQYDYDYLHRLRGEVSADTTALNREVSVASTFGTSFPIHAPKSVTVGGASYNYAYDGNGNMTSGSDYASPGSVVNRSITYNAENMPVSVTRGSALPVEFVYDGQNVRARKSTLTGETYYYNELFEVTNSAPVKYVFAGNLRIAKLDVNGAYYFHKDHLGSSTTVTNETGAV
ncbi:MAG: RHS repeat protein, partial [Nitrospirae bacterium]|nr:RHS repeat protein [Nitrospirota bacterium]